MSRKCGKLGLFTGKVVSYDEDDDLYLIQYTDGDLEDFDETEYLFIYDLYRDNKRKPDNEDSASDGDTYAEGILACSTCDYSGVVICLEYTSFTYVNA